jgi:hypothetical protein
MTEGFKILTMAGKDDAFTRFGPTDPETGLRLSIPEKLERTVSYPALKLQVGLFCVFSGERLEIEKMTIESMGSFVTSRDLTQLALPQVMYQIVSDAVPEAMVLSKLADKENPFKPDGAAFLAMLYWFEHAGWGAPRARIMEYMGWSRANANFHLKRISANFPLPATRSQGARRPEEQWLSGTREPID